LTPAQQALTEFLDLDPDLLAVAAQTPAEEGPNWDDLSATLDKLDTAEKNHWLMRLFEGEEPNLSALFLQRLHRELPSAPPSASPVTAAALWGEAQARAEVRRKQEQRRKADRKARREREAAIRLNAQLDTLEAREDAAWEEVVERISEKQARAYDAAVEQLNLLHALAQRRNSITHFGTRLREVLAQFNTRPALKQRLKQAGLDKHLTQ